ncbi:amino acid/amide ABC transporter membrane protein 2, HAAT family [Tistlia consotensis]|uniref:Amino acid/amide ABC transporter membrane protein 2, HAAT family n=1 Tax=Tistlia consotensis USBA 355 TaxID=560819 RepID=A0A1Y6B5M4_9PROT|nr:branched-chain amino acid ABC transporter permease [Tistlia consotensis]SME91115.1 amino acid/amide ABC transporter membrane protein 2, HAAT family [Tistlia consotensis USBA 355]SNR27128.1 amino acid/amide ABC transporter membrane protein 2, HAAT family [Tistlia consotensis]
MAARALLLPLGAAGALLLPLAFGNPYALSVVILALLYAYLALSWNLIGGITGQLSLGHAAYFGIGAYTSTVLFADLGLTPWLGMLAGAVLAGIAAVVIGLPCFRLRGAYYALATLAAAVILKVVVENSNELLGGPRGLDVRLLHDAPLYFQHTSKLFYYYVVLLLVGGALAANRWCLRSRFGYYLTAIRNDQEAAAALGVDARRYKLLAAVLSAAMTAIGGTFYAQYALFISPEKVFGVHLSVQIAVICIIGGRGTLWGPLLGALLLLMVVMRFEPRGVIALLGRALSGSRRLSGKAAKVRREAA